MAFNSQALNMLKSLGSPEDLLYFASGVTENTIGRLSNQAIESATGLNIPSVTGLTGHLASEAVTNLMMDISYDKAQSWSGLFNHNEDFVMSHNFPRKYLGKEYFQNSIINGVPETGHDKFSTDLSLLNDTNSAVTSKLLNLFGDSSEMYNIMQKLNLSYLKKYFFEKMMNNWVIQPKIILSITENPGNLNDTNIRNGFSNIDAKKDYQQNHEPVLFTSALEDIMLPALESKTVSHSRYGQELKMNNNYSFNKTIDVTFKTDVRNLINKIIFKIIDNTKYNNFERDSYNSTFNIYISLLQPQQSVPIKGNREGKNTWGDFMGVNSAIENWSSIGQDPLKDVTLKRNLPVLYTYKFKDIFIERIEGKNVQNSDNTPFTRLFTFGYNGVDTEFFDNQADYDDLFMTSFSTFSILYENFKDKAMDKAYNL